MRINVDAEHHHACLALLERALRVARRRHLVDLDLPIHDSRHWADRHCATLARPRHRPHPQAQPDHQHLTRHPRQCLPLGLLQHGDTLLQHRLAAPVADRWRNRVDQLRLQQRAGVEAAQRGLRGNGAGIAGQFLVTQETTCGPWQQRVEPEHRAHQQQHAVGPVIAIATMAVLVLQDQALLLRAELLVEIRADHDAWPPQAHQRRQPGISAGLPAAIGTWPQRAQVPLEATLCTQVAQQAGACAQRPHQQQHQRPLQRRRWQAVHGFRHDLQRQGRHMLQQRDLWQGNQQRDQQQGQQPPAAVSQPGAAQSHQQRPRHRQQGRAQRQPQAGPPQSVEQLIHHPAPGSASSVRRCPARSVDRVR
ncbi:hypothetical protein D3C81_459420 [compost metagenome]